MQRAALIIAAWILPLTASFAQSEGGAGAKRKGPESPEAKWQVRKAPTVERIEPRSAGPGAVVELVGQNFDEATTVRFNGRPLRPIFRSATRIRVRLPTTAVSDRFVVAKPGFDELTTEPAFEVVRAPAIARFTPQRGDPGISVTIEGKNFLSSDHVVLGTVELKVRSAQPERLVVVLPREVQSARFGVKRGDKIAAWSTETFQVSLPPPVITKVEPVRGGPGTVVTVTGRHFDSADRLELAGKPLLVKRRTASSMEAVIGQHASGAIVLRGADGRHAEATARFTVARPPVVTGFSPESGPPGTRVTISGAGFLAGDEALIGDALLTVRKVTDEQLVAEVPEGVSSGRLAVRRGEKIVAARGRFVVAHPPAVKAYSPTGGPPGTTVTLEGTDLTADAQVLLAGQKLKVLRRRIPTAIVAKLPEDARTGTLVVVSRSGTWSSTTTFEVAQFPTLSAVVPLKGTAGSRIALSGQNFHKGMGVRLGEAEARVLSVSATKAVVELPAEASTGRLALVSRGRTIASAVTFTVEERPAELAFTFAPAVAKRGAEVTLTLTPPRYEVAVFFDDRPLPRRVLQGGKTVIITVPSDARTGQLEVEYNGRRYKADRPLKVR
ncbi:MAG: IPT/TIG domain-containing protein [Deltaproteobacteria bacterium]|nr:IPT/TIG domain-containing protein [Deltaproteobacteria bacterium]